MIRRFFCATALLLVSPGLISCIKNEPRDLAKSATCVQWMLKKSNFSRTAFALRFPDGEPSEYVDYLFSPLGMNDWPYSENYVEMDPMGLEEANSIRMPISPASVDFVARRVDPEKSRQLVLRFDDKRDLIILEGYEDPADEPVLYRELSFTVPPIDPQARMILEITLEANEDMGMYSARRGG